MSRPLIVNTRFSNHESSKTLDEQTTAALRISRKSPEPRAQQISRQITNFINNSNTAYRKLISTD